MSALALLPNARRRLADLSCASPARRYRRRLLIAACLAVAFLGWLLTGWGGTTLRVWAVDIGNLAASLAATFFCLRRGDRERGRLRAGWVLLGLYAAGEAIGDLAWVISVLVLHADVPFPSFSDLSYLFAVPCGLAALLSFYRPTHGWISRARIVVDAFIVGGSLLMISWEILLSESWSPGGYMLQNVIELAYPMSDVLFLSLALTVGGSLRQQDNVPLGLIAGALAAVAVSDTGFAWLAGTGRDVSGGIFDGGWIIGFSLLALAATRPAGHDAAPHWRGQRTSLPYVPVLAMLALMAGRLIMGQELTRMSWALVIVVVLFLVARQLVTLRENQTLAEGLEGLVASRTEELATSEARFRGVIQNVTDLITVVTPRGSVLYASPSCATLLGRPPRDMIDTSLLGLVHPDDVNPVASYLQRAGTGVPSAARRFEMRMLHADGSWVMTETSAVDSERIRELGGVLFTTRDITDRKHLERQLTYQAFHDPLTGLANRALFADRIDHALSAAGRSSQDLAVMFVDLDDFKAVNDSYGHDDGDRLLIEVARRLTTVVRPGDTVARLGGDEFAVLMEDVSTREAAAVARRLHQSLAVPVMINGVELVVSASLGIAHSGPDSRSASDVLRNADVAMYQAKGAGKSCTEVFRVEMHEAVVGKVQLLGELRHAVERGQFELYYQPLVNLQMLEVVGFEALLRWHHPDRGVVSPQEFIPLAEESGLIVPIGEWVIQTALAQLAAWDAEDLTPGRRLTMSVNVSPRQMQNPSFVARCGEILAVSKVNPSRLTLELTESILLNDGGDTVELLTSLKGLGLQLAIDDFGTGFSSLSYLRRFPVDTVKIDKSFVDEIGAQSSGGELVRAVIEIGRILGLHTVAEGVESALQAELLTADGCELAQGFGFSRPLPSNAVTAMMRAGVWPSIPLPRRSGQDVGGGAHPALAEVLAEPVTRSIPDALEAHSE